jgi:aspartyl-tRNA(Asn)/glutamyl-tRNA(Gln) amidotransferase subunit B
VATLIGSPVIASGLLGSDAATLAGSAIDQRGWRQISDSGELARLIDQVMTDNAKLVAEFQAGKEKAFNALVGQIMKASQGKANPQQVNDLLRKKLS